MKTLMTLTMAAFIGLTAVTAVQAAAREDGVWSGNDQNAFFEHRKKRVKGGSGCDDPDDVAEHAACR